MNKRRIRYCLDTSAAAETSVGQRRNCWTFRTIFLYLSSLTIHVIYQSFWVIAGHARSDGAMLIFNEARSNQIMSEQIRPDRFESDQINSGQLISSRISCRVADQRQASEHPRHISEREKGREIDGKTLNYRKTRAGDLAIGLGSMLCPGMQCNASLIDIACHNDTSEIKEPQGRRTPPGPFHSIIYFFPPSLLALEQR